MENRTETTRATDNRPRPVAVEQMCKPEFRNADNNDLWPWQKAVSGGDAPEVNGHWAGEIPEFVPTSGELLMLAEHWTDVAIQRTYVEWANAPVCVIPRPNAPESFSTNSRQKPTESTASKYLNYHVLSQICRGEEGRIDGLHTRS
jgi:hypothetical protein